MPRFAGDQLPGGAVGQTVALADKLDTMIGIFGIGQRPTGDRDPFALRRAAIGVLRIAIECRLEVDIPSLLEKAVAAYGDRLTESDTAVLVLKFLLDRLRGYYLEDGLAPDLFDAVVALNPVRPFDFDQRIRAVNNFRTLPEAASLAAANKRVRNILRQNESAIAAAVDTALLGEGAELALFKELSSMQDEVAPILANGDYSMALATMASLRPAVDRFFNEVMVMDEDVALRANRLALLSQMDNLFMQVADLSMLQA
jgi:glycyl-tRNA synthetase beta chain